METNVYVTDMDMIEHIGHEWDMTVENGRIYLICDCGETITSCEIPVGYTAAGLREKIRNENDGRFK